MEDSKVCTKCEIVKSLIEFCKDKCQKSGYCLWCRPCKNIQAKQIRQKYSSMENKEIKERKVCSHCKQERTVLEYAKNRRCKDGFANECNECKYKRGNAYCKARKLYDPKFKLLTNMRSRLSKVLKGKLKSQSTLQLIGVNFEIFTKWIEFQFEEGMIMKNYGSAWCHDHVLPISSFNLLDEEELLKAMNWKNIRPCTPLKNNQKSNKIDRWLYVMQEVKAVYFIKHLDEL